MPAPIGVGISHLPGLLETLEVDGCIDLVEIEPQTFWLPTGRPDEPFRLDADQLGEIESSALPKVVHGIGFPVGGTIPPDPKHVAVLDDCVHRLDARWASEHLSFNVAPARHGRYNTGFLLPPRQTNAGVAAAARSIRSVADRLSVPFAIETGVNYLRRRNDEMSDGRFIAAVVERAGCGIVLDLHNLWCNERNGRDSVADVVAQLPLEQVWEVHLAGGSARDSFWLDSHSGLVPDQLWPVVEEVLRRLPDLGAIVFELYESWLPSVGVDAVRRELERIRALWDTRAGSSAPVPSLGAESCELTPTNGEEPSPADPTVGPDPSTWETTLGALVVGGDELPIPCPSLRDSLLNDPGVVLVRSLLEQFRAGMIAQALPRTVRLLLLTVGVDRTQALLADHFVASPPALFKFDEGVAFARHLRSTELDVAGLEDVLTFELAAGRAFASGEAQVVRFDADPRPLLVALARGRLDADETPSETPDGFEIVLTPD